MATPLIPQEIYLLERYSSLDYYREMRDAWVKMLAVAEQALQQHALKLPSDYRSRHLSEQPDITWGECVLPNFRSTMASVDSGYVLLQHGDLSALGFGGNVKSALIGQIRDYLPDWMPEELEKQFWYWRNEASMRASNMSFTEQAGWKIGSLTTRYSSESRGPLTPPSSWPQYRLNPSVTVTTGQPVVQSGIYLPACDDSCAEVLIKDYECFEATVGYDPIRMQNTSMQPTTWTLVERIADSGGMPGSANSGADAAASQRLRVEGGKACPQTGWYFTPAKAGGRRFVTAGTVMPIFDTDYGATIWQWDVNQSTPKL